MGGTKLGRKMSDGSDNRERCLTYGLPAFEQSPAWVGAEQAACNAASLHHYRRDGRARLQPAAGDRKLARQEPCPPVQDVRAFAAPVDSGSTLEQRRIELVLAREWQAVKGAPASLDADADRVRDGDVGIELCLISFSAMMKMLRENRSSGAAGQLLNRILCSLRPERVHIALYLNAGRQANRRRREELANCHGFLKKPRTAPTQVHLHVGGAAQSSPERRRRSASAAVSTITAESPCLLPPAYLLPHRSPEKARWQDMKLLMEPGRPVKCE